MSEYVLNLIEDPTDSEFYPTPKPLIDKMLEEVDLWKFDTILEPSAGKGDILREIARQEDTYHRRGFDVDCIEIDPNLRQILKYNFSESRENSICSSIREIKDSRQYNRDKGRYEPYTAEQEAKLEAYESEEETFFSNGIHIVFDDFLNFTTYKQYDLIIMNPPFSNGDLHLLKAIEIQKRGGAIICLLNAETIRNPFTERRKHLVELLNQYGAQIEYIENAFSDSERRTDVEVALIKVFIPEAVDESEIYNRFKKAENLDDDFSTATDLEITDYIKAAVNLFKVESSAGVDLIRQYRAMVPYMSCSFEGDSYDKKPILRLTDSYDRGYESVSVNQYLKRVRHKYWQALLSNPKYIGKLTSKLQGEYQNMVDKLSDYDFNEFNIYTLSAEMNSKIKRGIEDEIEVMFDRLTEEHTWYPECQKNKHYFSGWKTNKAHKIDKKVIIPCYGVFSSWSGRPSEYEASKTVEDIERVLNFFDGNMTVEVNLWDTIRRYFNAGITKKIPLKFFDVTFYKKGTVHIIFKCPELIERFNIYAGKRKNWLPPSYGKKVYAEMSMEEKDVIDSFQGEEAYAEVLRRADYYLAPVTDKQEILMLQG